MTDDHTAQQVTALASRLVRRMAAGQAATGKSPQPASKPCKKMPVAAKADLIVGTAKETYEVTLTFDWKLEGLKDMFEKTVDDVKTRAWRSPPFDGGRWQLCWYPNGGNGEKSCSLFIQALPTFGEKQVGESWMREGAYRFTFELRSLNKALSYVNVALKGPVRTFSGEVPSSGWSKLITRSAAFDKNPTAKADDGFIITCCLTQLGADPSPVCTLSARHLVPSNLVESISDFLDNPDCADVVFVINPSRRAEVGKRWRTRRIYASRSFLAARCDYMKAMFTLGFIESRDKQASEADVGAEADRFEEASQDDVFEEDGWDESDYQGLGEIAKRPTRNKSRILTPRTKQGQSTGARARQDFRTSRRMPEVVVTDFSYRTFKALLYYLYTDQVAFLPIASSPEKSDEVLPGASGQKGPPASAKAIYAAADKMGLEGLKQRAFAYLKQSLTVDNVAHQLFGGFAQKYDEIKAMETEFILQNWGKVDLEKVLSDPDVYPDALEVVKTLLPSLSYTASDKK